MRAVADNAAVITYMHIGVVVFPVCNPGDCVYKCYGFIKVLEAEASLDALVVTIQRPIGCLLQQLLRLLPA